MGVAAEVPRCLRSITWRPREVEVVVEGEGEEGGTRLAQHIVIDNEEDKESAESRRLYSANETISELFGCISQLDEAFTGRISQEEFRHNFGDRRSSLHLGLEAAFRAGENGLTGPSAKSEIDNHLNLAMLETLVRCSLCIVNDDGQEETNEAAIEYARSSMDKTDMREVKELIVGDLLRGAVKHIDGIKAAKALASKAEAEKKLALAAHRKAMEKAQAELIAEQNKARIAEERAHSDGAGMVSGPYFHGSMGHFVKNITRFPQASFRSQVKKGQFFQHTEATRNPQMSPGVHFDLLETASGNTIWGKYVAEARWDELQAKNEAAKEMNQCNAAAVVEARKQGKEPPKYRPQWCDTRSIKFRPPCLGPTPESKIPKEKQPDIRTLQGRQFATYNSVVSKDKKAADRAYEEKNRRDFRT